MTATAEPLASACGHPLAWYAEPSATLFLGDAVSVLAGLPEGSVDVCITSPPFLGLRKYAGEQELIWNAGDGCEHVWQNQEHHDSRGIEGSTLAGSFQVEALRFDKTSATCSLCGAWRGPWGLEPSVDAYIRDCIEVFQAVKRVLKLTGCCFIEIGDSYAGAQSGELNKGFNERWGHSSGARKQEIPNLHRPIPNGLKPKDLCLVPERLAIALQNDGWWVRSRIIWAKSNPMPESCRDRPTKSHSTIWMLTKGADYYFDQEAVKEKGVYPAGTRGAKGSVARQAVEGVNARPPEYKIYDGGRNLRDVWTMNTSPFGYELCQSCGQIYTAAQFGRLPHQDKRTASVHGRLTFKSGLAYLNEESIEPSQKLCRCGASDFLSHFATYPEALPTRCILAATSEAGCCPKCGKPWVRVIKAPVPIIGKDIPEAQRQGPYQRTSATSALRVSNSSNLTRWKAEHPTQTLGWAASCQCELPQAENVPAVVLDCAVGSGTTLVAAKKLGRRSIGIDLSPLYLALARRRLEEVPLSLGVK